MKTKPVQASTKLTDRVIALIEESRRKTVAAVNFAMVYTYYEIGRQIVEEEQGGKRRAGYGEKILNDLSAKLTARYGRGWSVENLTLMRKFFIVYSGIEISQTSFAKSAGEIVNTVYEIGQPKNPGNYPIPKFTLSWSHYLKRQDIGQMQMYVNYYDRAVKMPDENPTIGILLCHDKNDTLVEYSLPKENNRIFASKYRTVLPSKAQLKRLVARDLNSAGEEDR